MKDAANAPISMQRRTLAGAAALLASGWGGLAQAASPSSGLQTTGASHPAMAPFDALMADFMPRHQVPGAQLAVSHQGRMVYARGFGVADRSQPGAVQPTSLFRIASISKPVTSAAVVQWIERGKLSLDSRVVSVLGLSDAADARWQQITIRHLLQHTGGWDRDTSFDPMFESASIARALNTQPPPTPAQIIRYMLGQRLQAAPGSRYAYSNFGYCLLGRVIEKLSGQAYEASVQQQLLQPLGIRRMRLGHTALAQRAEGEVAYHAERNDRGETINGRNREGVALPYGAWSLEAMDSHGGWLACAPDLLRFARAFDRPGPPFLRADSIAAMWQRPPGAAGLDGGGPGSPKGPSSQLPAVHYGLGWRVRTLPGGQINTWHTGLLDGTSTLLVRRHDGLHWAVLFNARAAQDGQPLAAHIDPPLHQAADRVRQWPTIDLFTELR